MADTIRVATGKTGKELDTLVGDAKKVGTEVPTSFADAGKAVGFLSQRLDITGKPLRTLADQLLEVSRLTGTDLQTNMDSAAGALAKFGVPAGQASATIDKLWRAAQASQTPFADLAGELTKFGVPLQAFGFNLDESTALIASFHKAGVNVRPAMAGLTKGLATLAKAGKDPVKGLQDTFDTIKTAKSPTEATAAAIKLFGARAGPELAAAIRSGKLGIDDLQKVISKGRETVIKAGHDTADFSEQWKLFKNRVAVAVGPAAEAMFAGIGKGMEALNKQMPAIQAALGRELGPALKGLGPAFASIGDSIKQLTPVWKFIADVAVANIKVIVAAIKEFAAILGGVIKIVHGLLTLDFGEVWDGAKQIVEGFLTYYKTIGQALLGPLMDVLGPIKSAAVSVGSAILDGLKAGVAPIVGLATAAFDGVRNAITSAVGAISSAAHAVGTAISTALTTVLSTLGRLATTAFAAVRTAISAATGAISTAARAVGTAVATGLTAVFNTLRTITTTAFNAVVAAIRAAIGFATTAAHAYAQAVVTGITTLFNTLKTVATTAFNAVVSSIRGAIGAATTAATAIGTAIVGALRAGLAGVYGAVKGGLDAIWRAITAVAGAAAGAAAQIGSAIVGGIVSGLGSLISSVGGAIASKVHGAIDWAKGHVGSTAEEYAKSQLGDPIPVGIIKGVVEGEKPLSDAIAKTVASAVDAGRVSVAAGRSKFSGAWDEIASGALEAFDKMKGQLRTSAEKMLDQMEIARQVAELKANIASATTELAAAQAAQAALKPEEGETPEAFAARAEEAKQRVLAAEQSLADANYEQKRVNLEKLAALQRTQMDARIASDREKLEAQLAAQGTALAQGNTNVVTAHNNLLKTLGTYGVKYQAAGKVLGVAFVKGLNTDINAGMADLEALLIRIRNAISAVTSANAGVHAAAPAAAGLAAGGLAGPVALAGGSGETLYGRRSPFAGVTSAIRSARAPALDMPATIVRVYIGDEELRGIVRTEVGYVDDATARVLLSGSRA
jgi:TP901 family phage tail tape measure protein